MEQDKLLLLKKIFNQLKVHEIKQINERSVILSFEKDIIMYIDAASSGIDFSIEARTHAAVKILEDIEAI